LSEEFRLDELRMARCGNTENVHFDHDMVACTKGGVSSTGVMTRSGQLENEPA